MATRVLDILNFSNRRNPKPTADQKDAKALPDKLGH
jgi:hypothetical protein